MLNDTLLNELNARFSFENTNSQLYFTKGPGEIPRLEVTNKKGSAVISLQGAHLLSWNPVNQQEVIWLSDDARFEQGKSVRGGIPICWPWFGAHENEASFPAHGFARTVLWQVNDVTELSAKETRITFCLETESLTDVIKMMWPIATRVEYHVTVSDYLKLELVTHNVGDEAIILSQALHTYFSVNDISKTTLHGLEGKTYLDKTDGFNAKNQQGEIVITGEVDRIYLDTTDDVIIDNQERKISISKQGSHSTVVWNPWQHVAEKMGDMGKIGYQEMLCVESANAATDVVCIQPGDSHCLQVVYNVS